MNLITAPIKLALAPLTILNKIAELQAENAELRNQRDFLARRLRENRWGIEEDCVGLSSNAMIYQAIFDEERPACFPLDHADLARCEATYRMAPPSLQKKMLPTLELFRQQAHVWPRGQR